MCIQGLICTGACVVTIWPPIPDIYLIMAVEGVSKMLMTLFGIFC